MRFRQSKQMYLFLYLINLDLKAIILVTVCNNVTQSCMQTKEKCQFISGIDFNITMLRVTQSHKLIFPFTCTTANKAATYFTSFEQYATFLTLKCKTKATSKTNYPLYCGTCQSVQNRPVCAKQTRYSHEGQERENLSTC